MLVLGTLLLILVVLFCCRVSNMVGAVFGAAYLYAAIYIISVQLLSKKCHFGDPCWSGAPPPLHGIAALEAGAPLIPLHVSVTPCQVKVN